MSASMIFPNLPSMLAAFTGPSVRLWHSSTFPTILRILDPEFQLTSTTSILGWDRPCNVIALRFVVHTRMCTTPLFRKKFHWTKTLVSQKQSRNQNIKLISIFFSFQLKKNILAGNILNILRKSGNH